MNIKEYWDDCVKQRADALRSYFHEGASIQWPNTNECFTLDEFIRANCEYPGRWGVELKRVEQIGQSYITVARIFSLDDGTSVHVTSFMSVDQGKIRSLEEYWGDDGPPPKWRQEMHLGRSIAEN